VSGMERKGLLKWKGSIEAEGVVQNLVAMASDLAR